MTLPADPPSPAVALTSAVLVPVFKVASVEKTEAPSGSPGQDWYRYVLQSTRSTITGVRRGSRDVVHTYAAEAAERLNTRAVLGQSSWSPRGRKPAARPT